MQFIVGYSAQRSYNEIHLTINLIMYTHVPKLELSQVVQESPLLCTLCTLQSNEALQHLSQGCFNSAVNREVGIICSCSCLEKV